MKSDWNQTASRPVTRHSSAPLLFRIGFVALLFLHPRPGFAGNLDTIGVTRLRSLDPTLIGTGIYVAQAEAQGSSTNNDWEVYPGDPAQPFSLFTWISTNGSSTNFPNSLGNYSGHAGGVGYDFYGSAAGVAPGVLHVDNYEADYFYTYPVTSRTAISARVVNQSFTFGYLSVSDQQVTDLNYDNYAATYGTLFSSAVPNGGPVYAPGTDYNCVGVGSYGIGVVSAVGPTIDNGRSKPDIVAPAPATSYSTPLVAGAGAVLLQAAARGDGGTNLSAAGDLRTIKALLLNGALKPGDWTHTATNVLDTRYGAGVLNVLYSYNQLAAGQHPPTDSQQVPPGATHPPDTNGGPVASLLGWDYQTITSNPLYDAVNHYYFNLSTNASAPLTFTATITWNRGAGMTGINNLALFLYDASNGNLVASSISTVDNVQHLYLPSLPRGKYDLQVVKYGSAGQSLTPSEIYALAFQFYPVSSPPLSLGLQGANILLAWPSSPTIFNLQQTTNLTPPIAWAPVASVGLITNTTVQVTLPLPTVPTFFELVR